MKLKVRIKPYFYTKICMVSVYRYFSNEKNITETNFEFCLGNNVKGNGTNLNVKTVYNFSV